MQRILVAIDGSDASIRAGHFAADLASKMGAELTLVHVVPPAPFPIEGPVMPTPEMFVAMARKGDDVLRGAADQLRGVAPELSAVRKSGDPADQIVRAADAPDVELVVVGSRGFGPVKRALLGSVSDRVVHRCSKPVLVVH